MPREMSQSQSKQLRFHRAEVLGVAHSDADCPRVSGTGGGAGSRCFTGVVQCGESNVLGWTVGMDLVPVGMDTHSGDGLSAGDLCTCRSLGW